MKEEKQERRKKKIEMVTFEKQIMMGTSRVLNKNRKRRRGKKLGWERRGGRLRGTNDGGNRLRTRITERRKKDEREVVVTGQELFFSVPG